MTGWPMEKFEELLHYKFAEKKLNVVRDIFIFASFTGFSHKELFTLRQEDRDYLPQSTDLSFSTACLCFLSSIFDKLNNFH